WQDPSCLSGQRQELNTAVQRARRARDEPLRVELIENFRDGPAGHSHCRGKPGGCQPSPCCELIDRHPFRNRDILFLQGAREGARDSERPEIPRTSADYSAAEDERIACRGKVESHASLGYPGGDEINSSEE